MSSSARTSIIACGTPGASDRWVEVGTDGDLVVGRTGRFGSRLDADRRVRLHEWSLGWIDERLELRGSWPVVEVVTHRLGHLLRDLAHEIDDAGGDGRLVLESITARIDAATPTSHPDVVHALDPLEDPVAHLWARAYPLLRPALRAGATLDAVPLVLERFLREPDARAAASNFGEVNRPLVRALADSLLPVDGVIAFEPLVVASMAVAGCGPDALARILSTRPHRVGRVAFGPSDVERARSMYAETPPRQVAETLGTWLAAPDGLVALADGLAAWAPPVPDPPPMADRPHPRPAPVRAPADTGEVPIDYPLEWRRAVGTLVAGYQVRLPTCGNELMRWGLELDNCLGSFRISAAEGHTRILGLAEGGALRWAIEVTRSGVVRQFEAATNHRPREPFAKEVLGRLRELGLITADRRSTRPLGPPPR